MLLPLTLALLRVLLFERGGQRFGLPLTSVEEVVTVAETMSLGGREAIELRGRSVPLADLGAVIGAAAPELRAAPQAMIVASSGRRVAVALRPDRRGAGGRGQEPRAAARRGARLPRRGDHGRRRHRADPRPGVLDEAAPARGDPPWRAPEARGPPPKVLVVDDQFTVRELQRSILEAAGYRVETARDGREALAEGRPASRTSTSWSPTSRCRRWTASSCCARSARTRTSPSLPVVVVTSRGGEEDRRPRPRGGRRRLHRQGRVRPEGPARDGRAAARAMTPVGDPHRVLVCDDSPTYAEALAAFLERRRRARGRRHLRDRRGDPAGPGAPGAGPGDDGPGAAGHGRHARDRGDHALPPGADPGAQRRHPARLREGRGGARGGRARGAPEGPGAARRARRAGGGGAAPPAEAPRAHGRPGRQRARAAAAPADLPRAPPRWSAICASTGGPRALETVLTDLPADFPLPVLVVQHMGHGFIDGLVRWLDAARPAAGGRGRARTARRAGRLVRPGRRPPAAGAVDALALDRETAWAPPALGRRAVREPGRARPARARSASCSPAWGATAPAGVAAIRRPAAG